MRIDDAVHQVWPAFVLVSGLLLVGVAANSDALFFRAGRLLERLPGPPSILLVAGMTLVTAVTAVLNLDTAVVFLTPVLVLAARHRGVDEEPFLFSAVFMANASSLYLPGSNLTNLLVLAHDPVSGGTFAARMFAPALTATLATAVGLLLLFHRKLNGPQATREIAVAEPSTGVGLAAVFAAAVLTVLLANPAVPVLLVGLAAVGVQLARRALEQREVVRALGPLVLAGLFTLSIALGVLARSWDGPAQLLNSSGRWGTAAIRCARVCNDQQPARGGAALSTAVEPPTLPAARAEPRAEPGRHRVAVGIPMAEGCTASRTAAELGGLHNTRSAARAACHCHGPRRRDTPRGPALTARPQRSRRAIRYSNAEMYSRWSTAGGPPRVISPTDDDIRSRADAHLTSMTNRLALVVAAVAEAFGDAVGRGDEVRAERVDHLLE